MLEVRGPRRKGPRMRLLEGRVHRAYAETVFSVLVHLKRNLIHWLDVSWTLGKFYSGHGVDERILVSDEIPTE